MLDPMVGEVGFELADALLTSFAFVRGTFCFFDNSSFPSAPVILLVEVTYYPTVFESTTEPEEPRSVGERI
jgi:hypothetical protein